VLREEELRQRADEFATRAAAATNEEERVQLLTVAQACRELADEIEARGGAQGARSLDLTAENRPCSHSDRFRALDPLRLLSTSRVLTG
jgi:hypothetical protein